MMLANDNDVNSLNHCWTKSSISSSRSVRNLVLKTFWIYDNKLITRENKGEQNWHDFVLSGIASGVRACVGRCSCVNVFSMNGKNVCEREYVYL